jgi:hypothetical protein
LREKLRSRLATWASIAVVGTPPIVAMRAASWSEPWMIEET